MKWIVGIDEVGRGALAGPVVVAVAAIPVNVRFATRSLGALKDSKKLSPRQRAAWCAHLLEHPNVHCAIARIYPRGIERLNVSKAANLAAARAYARLVKAGHLNDNTSVFLDGGLFLGNGRRDARAKTVIKGDEKINAVKVASIIAKVHRDRYMVRLAKKFAMYGFDIHKGYGTKMHRAALQKHGPSAVHRLTFVS